MAFDLPNSSKFPPSKSVLLSNKAVNNGSPKLVNFAFLNSTKLTKQAFIDILPVIGANFVEPCKFIICFIHEKSLAMQVVGEFGFKRKVYYVCKKGKTLAVNSPNLPIFLPHIQLANSTSLS